MMKHQKNKKITGFLPVLFAIIGNVIITCLKFIGFLISGSGALFSESIHGIADISNQILLMIGIKRSIKQPDDNFSYGYGHERFFWAVISACSIFFLGAGITLAKGFGSFYNNEVPHINIFIYLILIVSFIVESFTFYLAYRELINTNPNYALKDALKYGDPSTIAVLFEDGIAVIGIIIAFLSIALTNLTGKSYWDSIGSILIGFMLAFMAISLILKNRPYLIGKVIPEEIKDKIIELLECEPTIEKIIDFKSYALDVNVYRIKCEVEFNSAILLKTAYKNGLKTEYKEIKNNYEEFLKFCVDHTDRIPRLMGSKIDEIEKKIQELEPKIRHINIEIN